MVQGQQNLSAKLSELNNFYKQLLEALDLKVDREGRIFIKGEKERPLTIKGLPVALPTEENIKNAVKVIDGVPTPVLVLFNPLDEDAIKGENESLKKLRQIIELKLNGVIYQLGETLFNIINDTEKEVSNIEIARFATLLNRHKAPGLKSPIDEKTITNWIKLYKNILTEHYETHSYVKIFSKRGGKINNIKYNRINILAFPFVENLEPIKPNKEKFLDLKLRSKDKHAYLSLFEYLFNTDVETLKEGFKFGSLNKIAPGFHALMLLYNFVYEKLSPIINTLFEIGLEDREAEFLSLKPLPIDVNNLGDFIDNIAIAITKVPKENELTTAAQQPAIQQNPLGNNTTTMTQEPTSNSPWAKLKSKVGTSNIQRAPLPGGMGYGPSPMVSRPMGPTPITNRQIPRPVGNPMVNNTIGPRPIGTNPMARPMGPRPINQGIPGQQQPVSSGYQNPFLVGRGR